MKIVTQKCENWNSKRCITKIKQSINKQENIVENKDKSGM